MTDELERIERIFQAAADLPAPDRAEFLARECGADTALRDKVEAMLENLDQGDSLRAHAAGTTPTEEGPGTTIGRYKLLQVIGEGGFGVVYMAEQTEPVVRRVALKVIKLGMDSKEIVARFEAERQALALMDHANIAKVLDGGSTESGRPYFVMELVRGISITEYCDEHNLAPNERIDLFRQVCHAVQHAHQKGVIHRDLKPSNVMVTMHDGKPMPKVIDFGIAKAMHTRLTEKTLFTEYRRFIGTPAYMSPEQSEMSALDVDTRTDIYSLGVLLYELLTGTTPFNTTELIERGLAEVQRVIRDVDPPRPSMRISTSGDQTIAAHRSLDVKQLSRAVRGDLDWIVMKSLAKERNRRYGTASDLAADLGRYLANEPVSAGPPSTSYRLRKYVARNRALVTFAAILLGSLVLGIIGTTAGMVEAAKQRDAAESETARTQRLLDFLVDTLALTNTEFTLEPNLSVRALLDSASEKIDETFAGDAATEAHLRTTVGRAYASLGSFRAAERHLRRAVDLIRHQPEYDRYELYVTLWTLTNVCFRLDRGDSFAIALRAREVGNAYIARTHPELAQRLEEFVIACQQAGREGASTKFEALSKQMDREVPPGDRMWPILADSLIAAAYSMWYTPQEAAVIPFLEKVLSIRRQFLPANHPQIGDATILLAGVLNRAGRAADAEAILRESIEGLRQVHEDDHWRIAYARSFLGECLAMQGRFDEAEKLLLESHATMSRTWTEDNFFGADSVLRIVAMYDAAGQPEKSGPFRDQLIEALAASKYVYPWRIARLMLGPAFGRIAVALDRAHMLIGQEAAFESVDGTVTDPRVREVVEEMIAARAEVPRDSTLGLVLARIMLRLAISISVDELPAARRALLDDVHTTFELHDGVVTVDRAETLAQLARMEHRGGKTREAGQLIDRATRLMDTTRHGGDWINANARIRIGRILTELGMFARAEDLIAPAFATLNRQVGPLHEDTQRTAKLMERIRAERAGPK